MSFTIADAKALAETWVDEVLDDNLILTWGNEFLRQAVDSKVWPESTETFTDIAANTWTALPTDFYRSIKITDADGLLCSDYAIRGSNIKFTVAGTYELTYIKYPAELAGISGEGNNVPLHDAFKYPLAEFLLFKQYNIEIDDDDDKKVAMEYEARYTASLKEIYGEMELNTSEGGSFQVQMRWS